MTIKTYGLNRGTNQSPEAIAVGTSTALSTAATADNDAATVVTDTTTADTDVGTVVTDLATTLSAWDAAAAAIIAISGDGYAAHQFTTGGSTGLTSAQLHTIMGLMNTALTDHLTSQTDANTAKTATTTAKTDAATLKTATAAALVAAALPADITLEMDLSKALNTQDIILAVQAFERRLETGNLGPADIGNI